MYVERSHLADTQYGAAVNSRPVNCHLARIGCRRLHVHYVRTLGNLSASELHGDLVRAFHCRIVRARVRLVTVIVERTTVLYEYEYVFVY